MVHITNFSIQSHVIIPRRQMALRLLKVATIFWLSFFGEDENGFPERVRWFLYGGSPMVPIQIPPG